MSAAPLLVVTKLFPDVAKCTLVGKIADPSPVENQCSKYVEADIFKIHSQSHSQLPKTQGGAPQGIGIREVPAGFSIFCLSVTRRIKVPSTTAHSYWEWIVSGAPIKRHIAPIILRVFCLGLLKARDQIDWWRSPGSLVADNIWDHQGLANCTLLGSGKFLSS